MFFFIVFAIALVHGASACAAGGYKSPTLKITFNSIKRDWTYAPNTSDVTAKTNMKEFLEEHFETAFNTAFPGIAMEAKMQDFAMENTRYYQCTQPISSTTEALKTIDTCKVDDNDNVVEKCLTTLAAGCVDINRKWTARFKYNRIAKPTPYQLTTMQREVKQLLQNEGLKVGKVDFGKSEAYLPIIEQYASKKKLPLLEAS